MGPKKQDKSAASNKREDNAEEILQAVIVADSFNERFLPITLEKPRCLLPLANVPLIEYTLEFLAVGGVQEVYVVCHSHGPMIRKYISNSKWSKGKPMLVHTLISPDSSSVGDVLRELDSRGCIGSDFILVSGDVVSNMKLDAVLQEHKERKLKDPNAIMTTVMKRAGTTHRIRSRNEEAIAVLDSETSELLQYIPIDKPNLTKTKIDLEIFSPKTKVVDVRHDLIDCQIDVCGVKVLPAFSDNFDFQDIRKDFVAGILRSEILGYTIYAHIIRDQYAARVRSTHLYDSISKDVLSRWTYPMVPDSNIVDGSCYSYSRGHFYKEDGVVLARDCKIGQMVIIGTGSTVDNHTRINASTIGRNCVIGKNVVIEGSYIWDNVVIGDNCRITRSIIADSSILKSNVTVEQGCLISFQVILGPNLKVPAYTKFSRLRKRIEVSEDGELESPDIEAQDWNPSEVGAEGKGYIWSDEANALEDSEEPPEQQKMWAIARNEAEHPIDVEEVSSDEDDDDDEEEDPIAVFLREAIETIQRAVQTNHTIDNAVVELNSLRFAYNAQFTHSLQAIIKVLVNSITDENNLSILAKWGKIIQMNIYAESDAHFAINLLLKEVSVREPLARRFPRILWNLWEDDFLNSSAVLSWWKTFKPETDLEKSLHPQIRKAVEAIYNSQFDDEDDEDEDDESEDEAPAKKPASKPAAAKPVAAPAAAKKPLTQKAAAASSDEDEDDSEDDDDEE